ncbi:MAG TPA: hypothetical protein VL486_14990 [Verrucomicrobiae bacterium]|nr:hypothetical protein [Verrucomicrobiae bacterium]
MKLTRRLTLILTVALGLALPARGGVILDDTWGDGTRSDQKPPTKSAWYSSKGSLLTATANSMTLSVSTGSVMVITYFTTNDASPVRLNVGDKLTASFTLTLNKVAAENKSTGFRLGLFDFGDSKNSPKRVSADKFSTSSQGFGVTGYALFQNMGATFHKSAPMDIRKRTNLSYTLMSTSDDWTSLGTGPGTTDAFPGFAEGTPYVLQFAVQRTGTNSVAIDATWSNTVNGATMTTSVTDGVATNSSFDGIALRPSGMSSTASKIIFHEVKIELTPAPAPPVASKRP